jgi:thymidylate kinase
MPLELSGRPVLGTAADLELFVDREQELEVIADTVGAGGNVLVLGERGSGRTSLLRVLDARLRAEHVRSLFVEGALVSSAAELLELIAYRVAPRRAPDYELRRGLERLPESARLLERVRHLERVLERSSALQVVLVDELTSAETAHVLFGRLRDELWRLPLRWVVAGSMADRVVYLRPPADAFFARVVTLDPLAAGSALSLLRARIPKAAASDARLRSIAATAEGNPRRLVRRAREILLEGREIEDVAASEERREGILAGLGEPARQVVAEIEANGPASASDEQFLRRLGMTRSRAAQLLAQLEREGILAGTYERAEGRRPRKHYALVP